MTSFQVEIAPSSPFGCAAVHNHRDPFQNNLNNLDITDLWVHQPQWQATSASAPASTAAPNTQYAYDGVDAHTNTNNTGDAPEPPTSTPPKDKWARAREIVFPASTTPPKNSVDVSNSGGVSSLVQKWRGFESGAKPPPPPPPPGAFSIDDDSIIGDWESDRTVLSGRSSIRGRDSDATESERLRVADIIRKLTPNEVCSSSPRTSLDQADLRSLPPVPGSRVRTSLDHSDLSRCLPPVACPPRIRGRQAYIDLLVQMERDRHKELQGLVARKPVSTFSHRGRIQAALKIKLLRRGMEAKEVGHSNIISFESHKAVHFRERVNRKAQKAPKDTTPKSNSATVTDAKSCLRAPKDHARDSEDCITSKQEDIRRTCPEPSGNNTNFLHRCEDLHRESTFIMQETNWEMESSSHSLSKSNSADINLNSADAAKSVERKEETRASNYELRDGPRDEGKQNIVEIAEYCATDVSHHEEGWEEFNYDDDQTNNRDWIDEVSRPRSDWEYLRQERYQEMLDPFLDNEDIRILLGRKSVSSFLSSGMREKIDQLMLPRSQGQQTVNNNNQRQDKRQAQRQRSEQGQALVSGRRQNEEYGEYFEEYEAASSAGQQYTECDEFVDSTTSSVAALWSQTNQNQGGHESSECSYQAVSPSSQQSSTNYCSQDMNGRNSSYSAHPSIEMELIYDLRRHMEQLHQEISELRKSIQCSTDMQVKLHRSIKKEVVAALSHPADAKSGRPKKGGRCCCVCSKVEVDCVLYRCGHMCTCFDCAQELHWSSGTCPICTAQIVDVVRTHSNY